MSEKWKISKWKFSKSRNLERPIFRHFEISNIETTKVESFDLKKNFMFVQIFRTKDTYIIDQIRNFGNFDSFTSWQFDNC